MPLIPAIDIKNGRCVRLTQGRMDAETVYSENPVEIAKRWEGQGAKLIHIVDLDGAIEGTPKNRDIIKEIIKAVNIHVQIGGGIRDVRVVQDYLDDPKVKRVILGTVAYKDPGLVKRLCDQFPGRIAVSIDARDGMMAIKGWVEVTEQKAIDLARNLEALGVSCIIYTDITRDGMLEGPNLKGIEGMVQAVNIPVVASGGVSTPKDLKSLATIRLDGVIVGKALYTGDIDLRRHSIMLTKRIIPCLDVKDGRVVKGISFVQLRDAGDPVECAKAYEEQGADELVFLDITASHEKRGIIIDVVERTAAEVSMPLTVGGGIRTLEDIKELLRAGADKVSINTAAVEAPDFVKRAAERFGTQCIVVAIDAKRRPVEWKLEDNADYYEEIGFKFYAANPATLVPSWEVYTHGGRNKTGLDVVEWAKKVEILGAGEVLLTSMDKDGTKEGYDLDLTSAVAEAVNIPVIASGGAGKLEHLYLAFTEGKADAVLAASIFHYGEFTIPQAKDFLKEKGIAVRIDDFRLTIDG